MFLLPERFVSSNMPLNNLTSIAESQIDAAAMDDIVKSISIPPRPVIVQQMQTELGKSDPDVRKAAHIVSQDVGLTVAVLKTVNSPLYGLSRKADSVEQAVGLIGVNQLSALVTAIALRTAMRGDTDSLATFYDLSSKRSFALLRLSRQLKNVDPQEAQTFGLFCDVAIPLLLARFPTYLDTLALAHKETERSFTEVEHACHHTDHALIGAIMAKSWGLPHNVSLAIRLHHDYNIFLDPKVPRDICAMVAMGLLAEVAIHRHAQLGPASEWAKGGDYVAGALVLAPPDIEELVDQLVEDFAAGID